MSTLRGIFFEEADARAVLLSLLRQGWEARLAREKLAGEDDDADHHWAVLTDAPEPVLDLLVETHGGWLDAGPDAGPAPLPPLDLPRGPRR